MQIIDWSLEVSILNISALRGHGQNGMTSGRFTYQKIGVRFPVAPFFPSLALVA
jgi:hypothetical protein